MYIYSKWSEKELIKLSASNSVAVLYELLGIYIAYCHESKKDDFKEYYTKNVGKQPYHFRNTAEIKIKNSLKAKEYIVSRKEIRLLFRTYKNIPIITSDGMGVIFEEIVDQIYGIEVLEEILPQLELSFTPQEFLYFQYWLVSKYVRVRNYATSLKKRAVFRRVLDQWEANRIFKLELEAKIHKDI